MLVSFNSSVSNNKFKTTSFKATNPFANITSQARALSLEGRINQIAKTGENIDFLNTQIQKLKEEGELAAAAVLKRARDQHGWFK